MGCQARHCISQNSYYNTIILPKDVYEMVNSADPDQTAPLEQSDQGLHCLLKPICPNTYWQSVGHLTRKSGVLGSIPGLATYFRFSICFFKKDSCQLLAKVCA